MSKGRINAKDASQKWSFLSQLGKSLRTITVVWRVVCTDLTTMGLMQTSQSQVLPLWARGKPANHRSHHYGPDANQPITGLTTMALRQTSQSQVSPRFACGAWRWPQSWTAQKNNDENEGSNIGLLHLK